jgi:hypothetical protein
MPVPQANSKPSVVVPSQPSAAIYPRLSLQQLETFAEEVHLFFDPTKYTRQANGNWLSAGGRTLSDAQFQAAVQRAQQSAGKTKAPAQLPQGVQQGQLFTPTSGKRQGQQLEVIGPGGPAAVRVRPVPKESDSTSATPAKKPRAFLFSAHKLKEAVDGAEKATKGDKPAVLNMANAVVAAGDSIGPSLNPAVVDQAIADGGKNEVTQAFGEAVKKGRLGQFMDWIRKVPDRAGQLLKFAVGLGKIALRAGVLAGGIWGGAAIGTMVGGPLGTAIGSAVGAIPAGILNRWMNQGTPEGVKDVAKSSLGVLAHIGTVAAACAAAASPWLLPMVWPELGSLLVAGAPPLMAELGLGQEWGAIMQGGAFAAIATGLRFTLPKILGTISSKLIFHKTYGRLPHADQHSERPQPVDCFGWEDWKAQGNLMVSPGGRKLTKPVYDRLAASSKAKKGSAQQKPTGTPKAPRRTRKPKPTEQTTPAQQTTKTKPLAPAADSSDQTRKEMEAIQKQIDGHRAAAQAHDAAAKFDRGPQPGTRRQASSVSQMLGGRLARPEADGVVVRGSNDQTKRAMQEKDATDLGKKLGLKITMLSPEEFDAPARKHLLPNRLGPETEPMVKMKPNGRFEMDPMQRFAWKLRFDGEIRFLGKAVDHLAKTRKQLIQEKPPGFEHIVEIVEQQEAEYRGRLKRRTALLDKIHNQWDSPSGGKISKAIGDTGRMAGKAAKLPFKLLDEGLTDMAKDFAAGGKAAIWQARRLYHVTNKATGKAAAWTMRQMATGGVALVRSALGRAVGKLFNMDRVAGALRIGSLGLVKTSGDELRHAVGSALTRKAEQWRTVMATMRDHGAWKGTLAAGQRLTGYFNGQFRNNRTKFGLPLAVAMEVATGLLDFTARHGIKLVGGAAGAAIGASIGHPYLGALAGGAATGRILGGVIGVANALRKLGGQAVAQTKATSSTKKMIRFAVNYLPNRLLYGKRPESDVRLRRAADGVLSLSPAGSAVSVLPSIAKRIAAKHKAAGTAVPEHIEKAANIRRKTASKITVHAEQFSEGHLPEVLNALRQQIVGMYALDGVQIPHITDEQLLPFLAAGLEEMEPGLLAA